MAVKKIAEFSFDEEIRVSECKTFVLRPNENKKNPQDPDFIGYRRIAAWKNEVKREVEKNGNM